MEIEHVGQRHFFSQVDTRFHVHPAYHMILISDGSNELLLKNRPPFSAGRNAVIFINPLLPHQFLADKTTGVEHTSIIWRFRDEEGGYSLFPLQKLLGMESDQYELYSIKELSEVDAKTFIRMQHEATCLRDYADMFVATMACWNLCFFCIRTFWPEIMNVNPEVSGSKEKLSKRVKNIIDSRIRKSDLEVIKIASWLQMHPNYINSVFKSTEGITICKYIRNKRLELAKNLLQNTDLKINEIADMCGYNLHSYFTRVFTRNCGMSPIEYRSKN